MPRQQNQRKDSRSSKSKAHLDSTFRAKRVPIRVAHHKHTGRRLPFYCTSYAALFFLLTFTSVLILLVSNSAKADQQIGSVQLSGVVKDKPPETAAKITYPATESGTKDSRIEVRGTCEPDTYIEIYRKKVFAGMTKCSASGDFAITISLVRDKNVLIAKTRDAIGQYGPDSSPVIVYFNPVNQFQQMIIYTEPIQKAIFAGQTLTLDYRVESSEPPYTIAIEWGDGTPATLVKHDKEGDYSASHIYDTAGQRTVNISGIGANGSTAFIQTIVVVYPANTSAGTTSSSNCSESSGANFSNYCFPTNSTLVKITEMLWPAIIVASLMTISFWVGEKLMIHQLRLKH